EPKLERRPQVRRLDGREVAEPAAVHAEDRHALGRHQLDRPQDRAVATDAHGEVGTVDVIAALDQHRLVAEPREPAHHVVGEPPGLVADRMGDERDAGHQPAPVRAWTKTSTLPSAPVRGETMRPIIAAPAAPSAATTPSTASSRLAGSRTTPRPRDASARPTSNCGLKGTTRSSLGLVGKTRAAG